MDLIVIYLSNRGGGLCNVSKYKGIHANLIQKIKVGTVGYYVLRTYKNRRDIW